MMSHSNVVRGAVFRLIVVLLLSKVSNEVAARFSVGFFGSDFVTRTWILDFRSTY
jgi:hypothetical protein